MFFLQLYVVFLAYDYKVTKNQKIVSVPIYFHVQCTFEEPLIEIPPKTRQWTCHYTFILM